MKNTRGITNTRILDNIERLVTIMYISRFNRITAAKIIQWNEV